MYLPFLRGLPTCTLHCPSDPQHIEWRMACRWSLLPDTCLAPFAVGSSVGIPGLSPVDRPLDQPGCASLCASLPSCEAYTFHALSLSCWLLSSVSERGTEEQGFISSLCSRGLGTSCCLDAPSCEGCPREEAWCDHSHKMCAACARERGRGEHTPLFCPSHHDPHYLKPPPAASQPNHEPPHPGPTTLPTDDVCELGITTVHA